MANWCMNYLTVSGERSGEFGELLKSLEDASTDEGQVIDFIDKGDIDGYFFDIYIDEYGVSYQTKWSPNINVLIKCAEHFGIDFELDYEEPGCLLYGQYKYEDGVLYGRQLGVFECEWEDTDDGGYSYHGELFESRTEITDMLLEKKDLQIIDYKKEYDAEN